MAEQKGKKNVSGIALMKPVPGVTIFPGYWNNNNPFAVKPKEQSSSMDALRATCGRFAKVLDVVAAGDWVHIDPHTFETDEHLVTEHAEHIFNLCSALDIIGAYWYQVCAITDNIIRLYSGYLIETVPSNTSYLPANAETIILGHKLRISRHTMVSTSIPKVTITNYFEIIS